jgi:D-lactate dehydrogenase
MKIYFVDPEPPEQAYFVEALPEHELHFPRSLEDVPEDAEIVSVFIHSRIDQAFLEDHPALRFISLRSTTHDHVDLLECARRGITISCIPTYGDHTVAEHTFALILALARRLRDACESHHRAGFTYEGLRGFQLRGKTLGVIGAGRIGRRVLHLGAAFGMKRLAYDPYPRPSAARRLGFRYVTLPELLVASDIISLHATLTPESIHLLDRDAFVLCRTGVIIINTARGALIDTEALLEAMDGGIVGGVGIDVLEDERVMRGGWAKLVRDQIVDRLHRALRPEEPRAVDPNRIRELTTLVQNEALISRPNVVFTPHIAFNSSEAVDRIDRTTVANIHAFLHHRPINLVGKREARQAASREKEKVKGPASHECVELRPTQPLHLTSTRVASALNA